MNARILLFDCCNSKESVNIKYTVYMLSLQIECILQQVLYNIHPYIHNTYIVLLQMDL